MSGTVQYCIYAKLTLKPYTCAQSDTCLKSSTTNLVLSTPQYYQHSSVLCLSMYMYSVIGYNMYTLRYIIYKDQDVAQINYATNVT